MIGYWLAAVKCGYRIGRDGKNAKLLAAEPTWLVCRQPGKDKHPIWHHGYRIGCYIRDAWQRLR